MQKKKSVSSSTSTTTALKYSKVVNESQKYSKVVEILIAVYSFALKAYTFSIVLILVRIHFYMNSIESISIPARTVPYS